MLIRKAVFITGIGNRVDEWQNTETDFPVVGDEVVLDLVVYRVVSRRWLDSYTMHVKVEVYVPDMT